MVGAVLSARYRLLRLLGEGGMGAVFEAQDISGPGPLRNQVLHPEYAKNEHVLARFYAEGEATSRLSHPNIARCFGYAQAEDRSPYIIMELLDGSTLTSYLKPGLAYDASMRSPSCAVCSARSPKRIGKGSCTATSSPTTCSWFAIRPVRPS